MFFPVQAKRFIIFLQIMESVDYIIKKMFRCLSLFDEKKIEEINHCFPFKKLKVDLAFDLFFYKYYLYAFLNFFFFSLNFITDFFMLIYSIVLLDPH